MTTLRQFIAARGGRWSQAGRNALESLVLLEQSGGCSKLLSECHQAIDFVRSGETGHSTAENIAINSVREWLHDSGLSNSEIKR